MKLWLMGVFVVVVALVSSFLYVYRFTLQTSNKTTDDDVDGDNDGDERQHQHNVCMCAQLAGLGRSKFLPKPLPQEINMLLSECDIGCYSDASEKSAAPTASITTTAPASTNDVAKCDSTQPTVDSRNANNLDTSLDDDDDDDNRIGWVCVCVCVSVSVRVSVHLFSKKWVLISRFEEHSTSIWFITLAIDRTNKRRLPYYSVPLAQCQEISYFHSNTTYTMGLIIDMPKRSCTAVPLFLSLFGPLSLTRCVHDVWVSFEIYPMPALKHKRVIKTLKTSQKSLHRNSNSKFNFISKHSYKSVCKRFQRF